jgi:hypothetical protein
MENIGYDQNDNSEGGGDSEVAFTHVTGQKESLIQSAPDQQLDGLSLKGEQGAEVARNVALLAAGLIRPQDLNDSRYYLSPDGSVGVVLNEDSLKAIGA